MNLEELKKNIYINGCVITAKDDEGDVYPVLINEIRTSLYDTVQRYTNGETPFIAWNINANAWIAPRPNWDYTIDQKGLDICHFLRKVDLFEKETVINFKKDTITEVLEKAQVSKQDILAGYYDFAGEFFHALGKIRRDAAGELKGIGDGITSLHEIYVPTLYGEHFINGTISKFQLLHMSQENLELCLTSNSGNSNADGMKVIIGRLETDFEPFNCEKEIKLSVRQLPKCRELYFGEETEMTKESAFLVADFLEKNKEDHLPSIKDTATRLYCEKLLADSMGKTYVALHGNYRGRMGCNSWNRGITGETKVTISSLEDIKKMAFHGAIIKEA